MDGSLLAIESSGRDGGGAALLAADGTVLAEERLADGIRGGVGLAPAAQRCLAHPAAAALGGVAVDIGPGSYTGLRVGVMFAKAFAWARGLPVAGAGSLDALAWTHRAAAPVLVAANTTRRDEVVLRVYDCAPDAAAPRGPVRAVWPDGLARLLDELGPDAAVVGDGADQLGEPIAAGLAGRVLARDPAPPPSAVGALGLARFGEQPGGDDLHALGPVYPRRAGVSMPVLGEPVERAR